MSTLNKLINFASPVLLVWWNGTISAAMALKVIHSFAICITLWQFQLCFIQFWPHFSQFPWSLDDIESPAVDFWTISLIFVYALHAATIIFTHLGCFYFGIFLSVFLTVAPTSSKGEEYCHFATVVLTMLLGLSALSDALFAQLTGLWWKSTVCVTFSQRW